jgi:hypothetical protein
VFFSKDILPQKMVVLALQFCRTTKEIATDIKHEANNYLQDSKMKQKTISYELP